MGSEKAGEKGLGEQGEDVFREFVIEVLLHNEAVADQLGLQPVDVAAAILLEMRGPLTVGAISEEMGLPSASTTRLVDRLEKAGYAQRVRGAHDRRMVTVVPLPAGMDDYEVVCTASSKRLNEVGAYFGPEQTPLLLDMLDRLAKAYRTATEELRKNADPAG